jgi:hypothetical protein
VPPSELPEEPSAVPPDPAIAHLDDEVLALRALGEDAGTATDDAHLASCARCQAELDQLRAVVSASRSLTDADRPVAPPSSVWEAIQAHVRGDRSAGSTAASSGAEVVPLADRRGRRSWSTSVLVAASVASLAVGVVLSAVATRESDPPSPATQVVAAASLAALPDHTGTGEATIVQRNGTDYLQIDASDLSQGQGFYEVWLIDPKTMQMVGLGALDSAEGLFPIPEGLDLSKYRLVDVSLEPMDGQPTHSGNSIVRGELAT